MTMGFIRAPTQSGTFEKVDPVPGKEWGTMVEGKRRQKDGEQRKRGERRGRLEERESLSSGQVDSVRPRGLGKAACLQVLLSKFSV